MSRVWMLSLLVLVLSSVPGLADKKNTNLGTVVTGEVRAASTDERGNVLAVEILVGDGDGEPYLVKETDKGRELKKLVGQSVVVQGIVTEDKLGWKTIEVKTYVQQDSLDDKHVTIPPKQK